MADQAHEWTDEQIEALRRKFRRTYSQAEAEMRAKLDNLMADFDTANKDWLERLKSGKVTQDEYDAWLKQMSMDRSFVGGMADTLANDAANTNRLVADYVNDRVPMVYAENANRAAFEVESGLGYDTHGFDLYDQSTVRRLIAKDNKLVREVRPDKAKDLAWNRQKFNGAITQSILQGESIPNTAKRLRTVLGMNENAAVRAARTAMTCAENAGRTDSYKRAKRLGIELEQEWMATLDQRTRHSHRELDGQHVPVGEKFKVDGIELEYPGDPSAPGEYVWNCRCTLVAWFPDIEQEDPERWSKLPKGMTYDDWKSGKKAEAKRKSDAGVVDGKDILATWKRREGEFDFEIDDVINAQGFDGKPRVVDADEFDRAVRAANGGDGLVMQRVYSAPDQATLDAYRDQLYHGKWYVDCSHGNDTYGKGMYTASSKSTSVTQQMEDEVSPYRREFSYTETMTLDPSAKVIGYNEVVAAKNDASVLERAIIGGENISDTERAIVRREVLREYSDEDRALARAAEREWDFDDYMDVIKKYSQREREFRELGTSEVAVLLGYDAIEVSGLNYTVVLNRTKLIIREP